MLPLWNIDRDIHAPSLPPVAYICILLNNISAAYLVYVKAYQKQGLSGKCACESFPLSVRLPGLGG